MRQIVHRTLAGVALAAAIVYPSYISYRIGNNRPLIEYVANNTEKIIAAQEKEIGIKFGLRPNINYMTSPVTPGTTYDGETNTIWIDADETVSPSNDIESIIQRLLKKGADKADETLYHELGHAYLRKLRLNNGIKLPADFLEKMKAKRVEEGVGEYFERRMTKYDGFESFRSVPWRMVKPIIDKYGEKGMIFMVSNLPEMKESDEAYQKRVMDALR